jgi:MFS family permease
MSSSSRIQDLPKVQRDTREEGGLRPWVMWGVGVSVYVVAIFHRSSLGVAATEAFARFGISASALSTFVMLQLVVYVGMQIPVGILVDRFGPKRLMLTGLALMALGQLAFALVSDFYPALAARALIGCGDAMTFVSVLRLAASWFPARRVALVGQLTGMVGMTGNLISAIPLTILLHSAGWTTSFLVAAGVTAALSTLVLPALKDTPPGRAKPYRARPLKETKRQLTEAWRTPSTRLALWLHFTAQFPANVFLLLWGAPFLRQGEGLSPSAAGGLLTVTLATTILYSPLLGAIMARRPELRLRAILAGITLTTAAWAAVLAVPGTAPLWLLVLLAIALGTCFPSSMLAFDVARAGNPPERLGTVSGIVNLGGGTGAVIAMLGIGFLLDAQAPHAAGHYALHDFRTALCIQAVLVAVGLAGIARLRRIALPVAATIGRTLVK